MATGKHPGEQKKQCVELEGSDLSRGPRRCLASASAGHTVQGHSQTLGFRSTRPVLERAGESKASGRKEKEPNHPLLGNLM